MFQYSPDKGAPGLCWAGGGGWAGVDTGDVAVCSETMEVKLSQEHNNIIHTLDKIYNTSYACQILITLHDMFY